MDAYGLVNEVTEVVEEKLSSREAVDVIVVLPGHYSVPRTSRSRGCGAVA